MPPASRRKNSAVIAQLEQSAPRYSLIQAARLAEIASFRAALARKDGAPVFHPGEFSPPGQEAIRFSARHSLAFPGCEVQRVERSDSAATVRRIEANLMGLSGASGVMPYHYTELLQNRQKLKDRTLEHFFNLFNHRTLSLFYRAALKYKLPLQYQRTREARGSRARRDTGTQALLSLIGLGASASQQRLHIDDESLLRYSGLFSQKVRNTSNLRQILSDYFAIPVEIEQFVGQWRELIEDARSRLPDFDHPQGQNVQLGRSFMLGRKGWFTQGKIRIILGPLTPAQLERMAPGTDTLKAFNELVQLYLGLEHDYEFIIRVYKQDKPRELTLNKTAMPVLGWNSWLTTHKDPKYRQGETEDIRVSAIRYR